ncbi:MAG TPA: hypothetical protein VJ485_01190 [archaeon]|nr:hypothetical protein [archaeon]
MAMAGTSGKREEARQGKCSVERCARGGEMQKCEHCGRDFCRQHIRAKPSSVMKVVHTELPDAIKSQIEKESKENGGHSCAPYFDAWLAKKQGKGGSKEKVEAREAGHISHVSHRAAAAKKREPGQKSPSHERNGKKKFLILGILIAGLAAIAYLGSGTAFFRDVQTYLNIPIGCNDGTHDEECSANRPYYCNNGVLMEKASVCGCAQGLVLAGDICRRPRICTDGTDPGKCSAIKPLYCEDGTLVSNASLCGCQEYSTPSWAYAPPAWNLSTPTQFPNPKWYTNNLTFTISGECSRIQRENMEKAFNFVGNMSENSSLRFVQVQECSQITVRCLNVTSATGLEQGFAGTSVSEKDEGFYSVITGAEITVTMGAQACEVPVMQVHQVLHGLGFSNVKDPMSMLNEWFGCLQEFKGSIREDIERIYPGQAGAFF